MYFVDRRDWHRRDNSSRFDRERAHFGVACMHETLAVVRAAPRRATHDADNDQQEHEAAAAAHDRKQRHVGQRGHNA